MMVQVERLIYEYPGKRALDDVSFSVAEGSITALVGPNGAGKTTLLRCIAGLDEPFSGYIAIGGVDVSEHPRQVHKTLGYLSDFFGLYDDLTVRQCLMFAARSHQLEGDAMHRQVQWAAERLELTPLLEQKAGTLSRGWRQRLGIAQAIIHAPKLLLLDEPASGLDPEARLALSRLFRRLRDEGLTLVVSSHILAELEDYCTDMLVLRGGKIQEHRAPSAGAGTKETRIRITLIGDAAAWIGHLREHAQVKSARLEEGEIDITFTGNDEAQATLLSGLIAAGARISAFTPQTMRLQDVYLSLAQEKSA